MLLKIMNIFLTHESKIRFAEQEMEKVQTYGNLKKEVS